MGPERNGALSILADEIGGDGLDISFRDNMPIIGDVQNTKAAKAFEGIKDKLSIAWLAENSDQQQFEAFRKLTTAQKAAILAYCLARTLCDGLARETADRVDAGNVALAATGFEVADSWRPTADNFLARFTRDQLLDLGAEIFSKGWRDKW